jgi:phospholipase C
MFDYYGRPGVKDKIRHIEEYTTDVQNGTLPQVAFIEGAYFTNLDEHPDDNPLFPGSGVQKGSKYVSNLINTLMYSRSWSDSVFILSYDEFGGFFDHVPPAQATPPDDLPPDLIQGNTCYNMPPTGVCGFNYTGFRVPLIVVSPFTNPHLVSHTPRDYTAILKLIEMRFNLPSLTARDAAQADMLEFFNFVNPPWATPPPPDQVPTQPTNELCDDSHLQ